MYLLYLDESGSPDGAADRHFVLAGAAVFERTTYYLSRALDEIQDRFFPGLPPIDFHASPIRSGKDFWRTQPVERRTQVLAEIAAAIAESNDPGVVLFGAVVEKSDELYGEEAVKRATAECCRRFDLLLTRRHFDAGDTQRGLVIFAEGQRHSLLCKRQRDPANSKLQTLWRMRCSCSTNAMTPR